MKEKQVCDMTKDELHKYKRGIWSWKDCEKRWAEIDKITKRLAQLRSHRQ